MEKYIEVTPEIALYLVTLNVAFLGGTQHDLRVHATAMAVCELIRNDWSDHDNEVWDRAARYMAEISDRDQRYEELKAKYDQAMSNLDEAIAEKLVSREPLDN